VDAPLAEFEKIAAEYPVFRVWKETWANDVIQYLP
jgi:hypothetical protein